MRVAYILSGTTNIGGASKAYLNMVRPLTEKGVEVLTICPDTDGIFQDIENGAVKDGNVKVIDYTYSCLPFTRSVRDYILWLPRLIKRVIKNKRASSRLSQILREFKPDIIHTNTSVNNIGYLAAKTLGVPHVWHVREYGDKDFSMIVPNQYKMLTSPGNYSIFITKDIRKYKRLDHNPTAEVIYDGVLEESAIQKPGRDSGYFMFAGNVSILKGIGDLTDAYRKYCNKVGLAKALPLKVAGPIDPTAKSLVEEISRSPIASKIEFLGRVQNITELYARAKAVIIPSRSEGFGFVMPEALAAGALVIARNTGGLKEQFENGVSLTGKEIGISFSNIDELADILENVADSPKEKYLEMIECGQKCVRELYSIRSHSDKVWNLYNKILGK